MSSEYIEDQQDFHRRILRMATVLVDNNYRFNESNEVWSDSFYNGHFLQFVEGVKPKPDLYKNRVHWQRAEIEGELLKRANNVLLPVDLAVVPHLFSCKAVVMLFILSGTYKAMLSRDKHHLKSRQFLINNVQSFSPSTIDRTLRDALAEKLIHEVTPDKTGRIKLLYGTTAAYRKAWCIQTIASVAVRTAWALIDLHETSNVLPAMRIKFWEDTLGHDRGIIDYAVSQIMVMRSKYSYDDANQFIE